MPSSKLLTECKSDASQTAALFRRHLSQLTIEDQRTYRKWERAVLIVYGAVAIVIVALSIVIGPTDSVSNKNEMYSSLAPAAHRPR